MIKTVEECCNLIGAIFDGKYGWMTEALAIISIILLFNVLSKWILKRLHLSFERQNKIWKDAFVRALHKPLSYYIWFFAGIQALSLLNFKFNATCSFVSEDQILDIGLILSITWFLIRWKHNCVDYMLLKAKNNQIHIESKKIDIYDKVLTITIIIFALFAILDVTSTNMTTLIAFGGVGGLAFAFASQEIVASFFGGMMIYITQPFAIGDWIQLSEKDIEGFVEEIGWYATRVRTFEKRPIYIPNSMFSKTVVTTPSKMSHRRFMETIRVRYEDMPKIPIVTEEIQEMLEDHPDVDPGQLHVANLRSIGECFLGIFVQCYTLILDAKGFYAFEQEIFLRILEIFEKHQVELAYPTYIYQEGKPKDLENK